MPQIFTTASAGMLRDMRFSKIWLPLRWYSPHMLWEQNKALQVEIKFAI